MLFYGGAPFEISIPLTEQGIYLNFMQLEPLYISVNTTGGGLSCCSVQLRNSKVSQGGLLNAVCLYLWCGLKGYWVSCVVEAGSLGDYCWAGNRQRTEYTEACLCCWPLSDHCPGLSCIHQAPWDQPALGGELLNSMLEPRSERTTSELQKHNHFGGFFWVFLPAVQY